MKRLILAAVMVALAAVVGAAKVDGRLAAVRKAFIVPVDELGDDQGVAACLAEHIKSLTPIEAVKAKEEADVVFRVSAHLPSTTTKVLVGVMGGSPSAHIYAELP